jgi:predicted ATPase
MLWHTLKFGAHAERFELFEEDITRVPVADGKPPWWLYRFDHGNARLNQPAYARLNQTPVDYSPDGTLVDADEVIREIQREDLRAEESILSQLKDPNRDNFITYLQMHYVRIRLYRSWTFGPGAAIRRGSKIDEPDDFLNDGGGNLVSVIGRISESTHDFRELKASLRRAYNGLEDVVLRPQGGLLQVYVVEEGGRQIPASRLSDGTLRYLCLLAILFQPGAPSLIAIEEPELGFHPDLIPHVAELLIQRSQRTQLVVTTHSRMLVDALGEDPESIVVCSKENGETRMERLSAEDLSEWLKKYSLGDLWSKGEIGGNRW